MRKRKISPLTIEEIKIILAISRGNNLSAAARALGMHVSTVSRAMTTIEEKIGLNLFDRQNPGSKIGRRLLNVIPLAQEVMEGVERLNDNIQDLVEGKWRDRRRIHVKLPEWLIGRFLHADFVTFLAAERNLDLAVSAQDNILENAEEIAVASAISRLENCVVKHIGDIAFAAAASRSYVAQNGAPRSVNDLPRHRIVVSDAQGQLRDLALWYEMLEAADCPRLYVETGRDLVDCVTDGFGVGVVPLTADLDPRILRCDELFHAQSELWLSFGRSTGDDPVGRQLIDAVEDLIRSAVPA